MVNLKYFVSGSRRDPADCAHDRTSAWAQSVSSAQVSGVVRDSSGGALPGADVTITKIDTGAVRTVVTSATTARYVIPNLPVGPYQLKVALQGFNTYVQDGIVLQVSSNPQINVTLAVGAVSEQVTVTANTHDGRDALDRHRPGRRQPARRRAAAQRPAGDGADLPRRPGHLRARGRPQHQQELSDRDDFGRRRPGQRHDLHHGRRHAQRSVQQPEPADAVSGCDAGVQGGNQLAAGALRPPCGLGGQHHHQVGHQRLQGQRVRVQPRLPLQRQQCLCARRATACGATQFGGVLGGPMVKNKAFFFGGYQGQIEKTNPPTSISYMPTRAMLNGDFTAFASPACNGGVQRNLTGGFVNNQIDPSRLSPIAQNFAKYLPVDQADPCGTRAVRHSPTTTPSIRALTKVDYTLNNQQSVFARYLYAVYDNPATYDGKNVLTLSRTGQNNQAHSIVVGHNFVLSSFVNALRVTYNKTINDRPLPEYFTATDLGSKVYSPLRGLHGHQRHRQRLRGRQRRHQSRLLRLGRLADRRRRRLPEGQPSDLVRRQLDSHQDRDAQQPPDQRRVHVQRPGHRPVARRLHDGRRSAAASCRAIRSTTTTITTTSAPTSRTTGACAPNLTAQRRRALGAVHPVAQHLQLGEQLRPGALRCRASRARSIRRRRPA